jgi:hypothetical protein
VESDPVRRQAMGSACRFCPEEVRPTRCSVDAHNAFSAGGAVVVAKTPVFLGGGRRLDEEVWT